MRSSLIMYNVVVIVVRLDSLGNSTILLFKIFKNFQDAERVICIGVPYMSTTRCIGRCRDGVHQQHLARCCDHLIHQFTNPVLSSCNTGNIECRICLHICYFRLHTPTIFIRRFSSRAPRAAVAGWSRWSHEKSPSVFQDEKIGSPGV